ncbi:hypothetical protein GCG54_00014666 [Colletotrichum gloeosporioides]|uniref:Uncharacterized protein n=1 Tax=Colletotrichum gloeosporioides TaxID=474922 RepID=A0A8H4FGK9_COLGL|nr:uncharacterized protein GCG54_00014666 [Colletotrichum gloeosporioides]KAF3801452.1 hypothetical protein GCG54_00014666 [Colletotrichum gloeosporioides]
MPAIWSAKINSAADLLKLRQSSFSIKRGFNDTGSPSSGPPAAFPAIIFGCVAVSMAVVFATCIFCARKRMKKRQTEYMKMYMRIATSNEGPAQNNKLRKTGMGQGTFPGPQYGTSGGGYNYTAGYNGSNSSAYDGPPPAYSSHQSGDSSMGSSGGSGGGGISLNTGST